MRLTINGAQPIGSFRFPIVLVLVFPSEDSEGRRGGLLMTPNAKEVSDKLTMIRTAEDVVMLKDKLMSSYFMTNPEATVETALKAADAMLKTMDDYSHFQWIQK